MTGEPGSPEKLKPGTGAPLFLILALMPPALAALAEVSGLDAAPKALDFYGTSAQVIATLFVLLAGLLGYLAPHLDHTRPETEAYVSAYTLGLLFGTAFGLTVSLLALGMDRSTTFLGIGAAATVAVQVVAGCVFASVSSIPTLFQAAKVGLAGNDGDTAPTAEVGQGKVPNG
jgi:hypothetical protein